jgi:hypothetical protein
MPGPPPASSGSGGAVGRAIAYGRDIYARVAPAIAVVAVAKVILNETGHQLEATGAQGGTAARVGHLFESAAKYLTGSRLTTPDEAQVIAAALQQRDQSRAAALIAARGVTPLMRPDIN